METSVHKEITGNIELVGIEPRDIYVLCKFPLEGLKKLKMLLDHAEIKYDGEDEPEMKEAVEYLNKVLYPTLHTWMEDIKWT